MKKILYFMAVVGIMSMTISCSNAPKSSEKETKVVENSYNFDQIYTLSGTVQLIPTVSETEMKSYILALDKPINIVFKNSESKNQDNVEEILLSFADEKLEMGNYVNTKITISGTLTATESMHDKRPVGIFDAILE